MTDEEKILSDDAGLKVMESLRLLVDKIESDIKRGELMVTDAKSYSLEAREYFKRRQDIDKRCCEEIKALIKEVRYDRI